MTPVVYVLSVLCLANAALALWGGQDIGSSSSFRSSSGLKPACVRDLECCNSVDRLPFKNTCYSDLFQCEKGFKAAGTDKSKLPEIRCINEYCSSELLCCSLSAEPGANATTEATETTEATATETTEAAATNATDAANDNDEMMQQKCLDTYIKCQNEVRDSPVGRASTNLDSCANANDKITLNDVHPFCVKEFVCCRRSQRLDAKACVEEYIETDSPCRRKYPKNSTTRPPLAESKCSEEYL